MPSIDRSDSAVLERVVKLNIKSATKKEIHGFSSPIDRSESAMLERAVKLDTKSAKMEVRGFQTCKVIGNTLNNIFINDKPPTLKGKFKRINNQFFKDNNLDLTLYNNNAIYNNLK